MPFVIVIDDELLLLVENDRELFSDWLVSEIVDQWNENKQSNV